jgi:RHS repeat-associated protein
VLQETVYYVYDGDGRRVQKFVGNTVTTYVYDAGGQLAAEYGPPTDSGTAYLTADNLGSTRLVTNGTEIKRYDYLPFGEEIPQGSYGRDTTYPAAAYPSGTLDTQAMKFTGKERDAESGLDYFGARYYSSGQGRFTTPDWSAKPEPVPYADLSNPQSLNLYAYVRDNPLTDRDLDGHYCFFGVIGTTCTTTPTAKATIGASGTNVFIGPLRQTTSLGQTQDRAVGAVKGLATDVLDVAQMLGAPDANIRQIRDYLSLYPSSQNQKFGSDIVGILAVMLPAGNTREIKVAGSSFEEARNLALEAMGEIDPATRQASVGRVGALRGEVTGFTTEVEDVFKQFRLDWDPNTGAHINVTVGKTKFAFTFPAGLDQVQTLLRGNVQK